METTTTTRDGPRLTPRVILGLCIMAFGLVLGLDNLGIIEAGAILRFWPLIIVAFGVKKALRPGHVVFGVIWACVGAALLLHNLGVVNVWRMWPFALVLLGGHIVYRAVTCERRRRPFDGDREPGIGVSVLYDEGEGAADGEHGDERVINVVAVLGGVQRTIRVSDFRGGTAVAVMGGCELDLRGSSIMEPEVVVDVTAFWGGIEMRVPEDWRVESRGIALLGGFADKTHAPLHGGKRLVITGIAVMGGVEVKN
jgi:hypothetical protein